MSTQMSDPYGVAVDVPENVAVRVKQAVNVRLAVAVNVGVGEADGVVVNEPFGPATASSYLRNVPVLDATQPSTCVGGFWTITSGWNAMDAGARSAEVRLPGCPRGKASEIEPLSKKSTEPCRPVAHALVAEIPEIERRGNTPLATGVWDAKGFVTVTS